MNRERNVQRLLVTGGAGFIGSAFIRYLMTKTPFQGICVNYDALTYAGNLDNLIPVADDPRYRFVRGDICDESLVETVCGQYEIDTLIHFAAETHVDRSILGPQAFMETNVLGTFHLLEVIRRHPRIHFHHVSTDEVYGCLGETGSFTETTPYAPRSPYSASKASSDHLVRSYSETYGISTCISNCSNNYGPYQFPEKLIPLMIVNCWRGRPLPVYGQGHNVRDWLYVDDHAAALWLLLRQGKKGDTYNIGGNEERRNIDIVHAVAELVAEKRGLHPNELLRLITYVRDRPGHDYRYSIDSSKLRETLNWHPHHSFNQGLHATVEWYLNHESWIERVESGAYKEWIAQQYAL